MPLLGFAREWWQSRQQVQKAAQEYRVERAKSSESYTREWELQALEGRDKWLRRVSFVIIIWPLAWVHIYPQDVADAFAKIEQLPAWYIGLVGSMWAVIWGVAEFKTFKAGK